MYEKQLQIAKNIIKNNGLFIPKKCLVKGCNNHEHEGRFIGDLCAPCHRYLTEGDIGYTESFLWEFSEKNLSKKGNKMRRLCILQESGIQSKDMDESNIHSIVTFDDIEFGQEELNRLNSKTDLPYYLAWVEMKLDRDSIGSIEAPPTQQRFIFDAQEALEAFISGEISTSNILNSTCFFESSRSTSLITIRSSKSKEDYPDIEEKTRSFKILLNILDKNGRINWEAGPKYETAKTITGVIQDGMYFLDDKWNNSEEVKKLPKAWYHPDNQSHFQIERIIKQVDQILS